MKRIVLWLVFIIFNSLGVLLIYTAYNHFTTAAASTDWPTVPGTIDSAKVVEEKVKHSTRGSREPAPFVYYAEIKYRYSVDGQDYNGDRLTVEDFATNDRERAEQIAMQYQAGQEVTVYYNPAAPNEAVLNPGESGGALGTLIMGLVFVVVPTCLVIFVGGRDLFPRTVQLWWDIKFGKYSKLQEGDQIHPSEQPPAAEAQPAEAALPDDAPKAQDFQETVADWRPGERVELFIDPPNLFYLLLGSAILGMFVALFGSVIIGMVFLEGVGFRAADERARFLGIFAVLFTLVAGYVFIASRWKGRASRTIFDWDANMLDAKREFASDWQGSLHDIQSLVVRSAPEGQRPVRYRAAVEVDVVGNHVVAARTARLRRKPEKAREEALTLAEPLARELSVPIRYEGWDQLES